MQNPQTNLEELKYVAAGYIHTSGKQKQGILYMYNS